MPVRFTTSQRIVPTAAVHPRAYEPGDVSDDPYVCEVALRNGWADDVTATAAPSRTDDAPAGAAATTEAPPARKARKSAPENK